MDRVRMVLGRLNVTPSSSRGEEDLFLLLLRGDIVVVALLLLLDDFDEPGSISSGKTRLLVIMTEIDFFFSFGQPKQKIPGISSGSQTLKLVEFTRYDATLPMIVVVVGSVHEKTHKLSTKIWLTTNT